jgi:hypothetical protein
MCPLIFFHQNPTDFLGKKKSCKLPFPRPQNLAESLPDLQSGEAWWIGTQCIFLGTVFIYFFLSHSDAIFKPTILFEPVFQPAQGIGTEETPLVVLRNVG